MMAMKYSLINGSDRDRDSPWENDRKSRSRSREYRDRDMDRYYRDKDNDSHRDKEYHRNRDKRSRRRSRWERKSEDRQIRDRDGQYRDEDRDSVDSERSPNGAVIGASGTEIIGYKSQPPNNKIMIGCLAQHITENDIRQEIIQCGLMPTAIRLIRKKDTGASRGFAFVEFSTLAEATRWMNMKQGVLMFQDQYSAIMQYSTPKELCQNSPSRDWFCIKCGAQNFNKRDNCFKCQASRMESENGGSGSDEICTYATKTIMLRNLDALTTEDLVMSVLNTVIPELVKTITGVCIGRDHLTSVSRGICYIGTNSIVDALALFGALSNLLNPLTIDGKTVILSYCKYNMGDTLKPYTQANNAVFPNASVLSTYGLSDVDSFAEYSANSYVKTAVEYQQYYEYYKNYFTQEMDSGNAVAQSAIQQMNANKTFYDATHISIPNGRDGKRYPVPDISKYTYDKSSEYLYDPSTGLYYDPNSNYYWNSVIQKYLYWDQQKLTYVLAPTTYVNYTAVASNSNIIQEPETKKPKIEKQDKVKVAKKIAKDMERWAKALNQKKESSSIHTTSDSSLILNKSAAADIGFSVLEKKNGEGLISGSIYKNEIQEDPRKQSAPLFPAYGGESKSSGEKDIPFGDGDFLDYVKLTCNLCKRQLSSADALTKHAKLSSLHKQNLEVRKGKKKEAAAELFFYRDRAKERRMIYEDPNVPQPSKLKEKYLKSRELVDISMNIASVGEPIGAENIGNRLLQKMGWTEGQGLGKFNQGRTTIIQAEQRSSTVGLGNKMLLGFSHGESYNDCVKKVMYARYQELTDKE